MLALIQHDLVTLLAALLIGVATGWWAFGRNRSSPPADHEAEESNRS